MDFLSPAFGLFVLATLGGFHLTPLPSVRRAVLTGSSLAFAASYFSGHAPVAAVPLILFVGVMLALVWLVARLPLAWRRGGAFASIGALLVMFLLFKSYLPSPLHASRWVTVGLSYIFFRALQLLSDLADGGVEAGEMSLPDLLLFTLSFLTFAAGPIQFYPSFKTQLDAALGSRFASLDWKAASFRMASGALKLLVLLPLVAPLYEDAMVMPHVRLFVRLGLAASAFLLYVYVSFSGYMDWMVAFGRALGFVVPENFDRPYRARNFLDLWNRWHITLSLTFRTYVFNPLLRLLLGDLMPGRRVLAGAVGYFTVFTLLGMWHGASWSFVLFGVCLGLAASGTKLWQGWRPSAPPALLKALETPAGAVFSAGFALTLLAMACIFTWPGWELAQTVAVMGGPLRLFGAACVALVCALAIVLLCRGAETVAGWPWMAWARPPLTHPAAACGWLLLAIILHTLLDRPLTGAVVYYQRF